jgi:hypothetical protein
MAILSSPPSLARSIGCPVPRGQGSKLLEWYLRSTAIIRQLLQYFIDFRWLQFRLQVQFSDELQQLRSCNVAICVQINALENRAENAKVRMFLRWWFCELAATLW